MSGGHTGDELQLDNVFFWRNHIDTAINDVRGQMSDANSQKLNANSQYYDLMGRRIARESLKKGIYIINGRKIVIR